LSSDELVDHLIDLTNHYPIISIEDGLGEDDKLGFQNLVKKTNSNLQIVGDDLFVTNAELIKLGIKNHEANSVLIKLNQIGTVTETIAAIKQAQDNN
jgi:enolase